MHWDVMNHFVQYIVSMYISSEMNMYLKRFPCKNLFTSTFVQ